MNEVASLLQNKPLSYSSLNTYMTCGYKYYLRYRKKFRSVFTSGALTYGSAIDRGLNVLLTTKDLEQAKAEFNKHWNFTYLNKEYVELTHNETIVYAESDFDEDLLTNDDKDKIQSFGHELQLLTFPSNNWDHAIKKFKEILEEKKERGWPALRKDMKQFYNYMNWLSMRRKGSIMLESYNKKILPRIKEVLAVQKENYLKNENGDQVVQYLDLIVVWEDGRRILFDNKTSTRDYEEDSAGKSPQLLSYYFGAKDQYKLDGVGFFVLKKIINKNKIKKCKTCGYDGSGATHKTCPTMVGKVRCNGEWDVSISPECYIKPIINGVVESVEKLVMSTFDETNEGIKRGVFNKNLNACQTGFKCEFFDYCFYGNKNEFLTLDEKI